MIRQLTGGQRLWLLFAIVLLASTIALIAVVWPKRDPALVADLAAAECAVWRGMPIERVPDAYPEPGEQCYAIRSFLFHQRVSLSTLDDYDAFRRRQGAKTAAGFLLGWAVLSVSGYLLAWSSARTVRALQRSADPGPGR